MSNEQRTTDNGLIRTATIGVGSLGRHHARNHAALASEGRCEFISVCDLREETARSIAEEYKTEWTTDWRSLIGRVDAVSLSTPTESHCEIGCALLEAGIHVLVEKPIARTLEEADKMIEAARKSGAMLMVGHLERYNPAMVALRPHVKSPLYFEIHRIGQFTARSLDIDVVLDVMIHDLDIVQWLVGEDVEVTGVHAVGIPVLTKKVDASNARIEFANGAVANITASRIGTEKIRKMRFFQPHDYVAVDYLTNYAALSGLAPQTGSMFPGINHRRLEIKQVEPLRAEIEDFLNAVTNKTSTPISGEDGRRALSLAIQVLERIHEHAKIAGVPSAK
jgi:predicted dehydrogenase